MRDPTDFAQLGPGLRSFTLNSAYALRVLAPEEEGRTVPPIEREWVVVREAEPPELRPPSPRT